jgi:hypothetical protein
MNQPAITAPYQLAPYVQQTVDFLNEIGIPTSVVPGASDFLELVKVIDGRLEVDPAVPVSNILHEAGHLAIVPSAFRHLMSGDLEEGVRRMFDEIKKLELHPDDPLSRAAMQASESEATAWAWAAGTHLEIPQELIILDSEYQNDGADIRFMLMANSHFGVHGLMHAGFCVARKNPRRDLPVYPKLAFWVQK